MHAVTSRVVLLAFIALIVPLLPQTLNSPQGLPQPESVSAAASGPRESMLPIATLVSFPEPRLGGRYRWRIIAAVTWCLLQTMLMAGLLNEYRRRKRANQALKDVNEQLQLRIDDVKSLGGRLLRAQEEERKRIARDLHDDIGQQIAALGMELSVVKKYIPRTEDEGRLQLAYVQKRVASLTESLRQLSHELHPGLLERCGLIRTLKSHSAEFQSLHGIEVHLSADLHDDAIPVPIALCIYRVAQESLRNVARHSFAKNVWIRLREVDRCIELTIADDGVGFEPSLGFSTGLGLISMKERVNLLDGSFQVESKPGSGTEVQACLRVPVARPEVMSVYAEAHGTPRHVIM